MPNRQGLSFRLSRWNRRHHWFVRYAIFGIAGVLLLVTLVQICYPVGRVLPMVSVEGIDMHGKTTVEAAKDLDTVYSNAKVIVRTKDASFTKPLNEIGIDINSGDTVRSAARYGIVQRLLPFSSVYMMLKRNTKLQIKIDDERLSYFAQQVEKDGFVPAVNAAIAVTDGKVNLVPAKRSKEYPQQSVVSALRNATLYPTTTITLQPTSKDAERTDDEVKGLLKDAEKAVNTPLSFKLGQEKVVVDKATIGRWLDFPEDPQTKRLTFALNADAVTKYLDSIQSKVYKAPGLTKVQIIDGHEVGRIEGEAGQGIDTDKTLVALDAAIKKGVQVDLVVAIAPIAPKVVYERQYSNTDAGLTAMLADLASAKGFGISIMELGGRSANTNGSKRFVAASTYKLYVAYALFKEIDAGRMTWSDTINGRSVDDCFEAMIVKSDNPCAKALGDKIGWQKIEDLMKGLGLADTELSPQLYTTANDLSLYLYKLANGALLPADQTAKLVDVMKRQIYRAGIPAGTGLPVANKVGFIDSYIHDAGIVYGPKGPYVLVIMTSGSSWGAIADAAKQINAFINR